jgi:hypothetical protein
MHHNASLATVGLATVFLCASHVPASAQFYEQHNLVSDGAIAADLVDP